MPSLVLLVVLAPTNWNFAGFAILVCKAAHGSTEARMANTYVLILYNLAFGVPLFVIPAVVPEMIMQLAYGTLELFYNRRWSINLLIPSVVVHNPTSWVVFLPPYG